VGIPAAKQGVIFEPFTQADGSTTRRYGGTGLGLAIAKQLIELMRGQIWVESVVDQGSRFHFTAQFGLPGGQMRDGAPTPTATLPSLPATMGVDHPATRRLGHILLAEDNPVNQRLVTHMLVNRGHTVEVVNSGAEALLALEDQAFDLVLMDVQMPEMDGLEATAAIRARERDTTHHIPIIAMTAHAMRGDREKCLAAGMDAYLSKPMTATALYTAIDQLLGQVPDPKGLTGEPAVDLSKAMETVEGDQALLAELVQVFNDGYPAQVAEVREAISQCDDTRLERAAHILKGEVGLLGAETAYHLSAELETLGREGHIAHAPRLLRELERELERIISFFDHVAWKTPIKRP
jgi:CheY-like chemotaxis protein/HPt (histidine-containing phosphotransfer) domain-containing protein